MTSLAPQSRLHLLGISGSGMSGIAIHAAARGMVVSGCDPSDAMAGRLRTAGIAYLGDHNPAHVDDVDVVGASTAIDDTHPELVRARDLAKPVLRRAELLRAITDNKRVISVSGTHGKTTTSAMVAHILKEVGLDPSYLVGGSAPTLRGGAGVGTSEWFVLEGDESDASFLGPDTDVAVVTNIEPEHLDFYGSIDAMYGAFGEFGASAQQLIVYGDSSNTAALCSLPNAVTYGTSDDVAVQLQVEALKGTESIGIVVRGAESVRLRLTIPGEHALLNATAALLAAEAAGVALDKGAAALENFANVDRRFSIRGHERGVTLVDDYAHMPTEIRTVIAAAKLLQPQRLVVVFQPHRYSRTENHAHEFTDCFVGADLLIVTDVYPAGESPRPGVTGERIIETVQAHDGERIIAYAPDRMTLAQFVSGRLQTGDLLLTLGAGDITNVSEELLALWHQT